MAQNWVAINPDQDHKWPIPMASLLSGSMSPTYQNLSPIAHHISPGQAFKDGWFTEASNMENALMQQPSHLCFLLPWIFPELHNMNKKSKCKQLFFIINFTRISEYQIHRGDTQRRIRRRCLQRDALHIYSWLIRTPSICFNAYKELSVQISSKN